MEYLEVYRATLLINTPKGLQAEGNRDKKKIENQELGKVSMVQDKEIKADMPKYNLPKK
jgi:hypothetical protein